MAPGTPLLLAVLWSVLGDGGVYLDRTGLRSSCGPAAVFGEERLVPYFDDTYVFTFHFVSTAGAPHLSRSGKGSLRSHPLRSCPIHLDFRCTGLGLSSLFMPKPIL
eukprot:196687-Amorphochlora_amoeboformis.AAC.2